MKTIYISGKISGLSKEEFKENFKKVEDRLSSIGYRVINPARIDIDKGSWEEYMEICLFLLEKADIIYMLDNYGDSKGAKQELERAKELGILVMYQHLDAHKYSTAFHTAPKELIDEMLAEQERQGNDQDLEIFEYFPEQGVLFGGFNWNKSLKGSEFWAAKINEITEGLN